MDVFRKVLENEEIPELGATLITSSGKSGSISNYQSARGKSAWCYE